MYKLPEEERDVRYHVPEFPHSSATFDIILGSHIPISPEVLQGALGDSAKLMVWDGVDETMEFCVQSADQGPILISRQDVLTNPLERYNTWDIRKLDTI